MSGDKRHHLCCLEDETLFSFNGVRIDFVNCCSSVVLVNEYISVMYRKGQQSLYTTYDTFNKDIHSACLSWNRGTKLVYDNA